MKWIKELLKLKRHFIVFAVYSKEGIMYNTIDYVMTKGCFVNYKTLIKSLQNEFNETIEIKGILEVTKKELEQFTK